MSRGPILVSWVAYNNDPYERERTDWRAFRQVHGKRVDGPTLTLLGADKPPWRGKIGRVELLHQDNPQRRDRDRTTVEETADAIRERHGVEVNRRPWSGEHDPTDYGAILAFVRRQLAEIRGEFPNRRLLLHISPGTPAMQTIWVLLGSTGEVPEPLTLMKSIPARHVQDGHPAVQKVQLDIDTFLKAYRRAEKAQPSGDPAFDPSRVRSPALRALYDQAQRYAALKVPVLILGERGTGKTTLANWVRATSPWQQKRKDKTWPRVACGQYSPETMRAELFGYRKGAFTGANEDRDGVLAMADKDSLFLDEIGDISHDLQRLLIKAVEDGQYYRLGDLEPQESDFRLICATNRPWQALQDEMTPDFLDRVSFFRLETLPLRELPDDLSWMWDDVWRQAQVRAHTSSHKLSETALSIIVEALRTRRLLGNFRDLYRVAFELLAYLARGEDEVEAVGFALDATAEQGSDLGHVALSKAVALSFAAGGGLHPSMWPEGPMPAQRVLKAFQHWLGVQLGAIGRRHGIAMKDVADVSERTLRNWRSGQND